MMFNKDLDKVGVWVFLGLVGCGKLFGEIGGIFCWEIAGEVEN
jgi:hypothetical protein